MNLHIYIYQNFQISNDRVLNKQKDFQYRKIIGLIIGTGKGIDPVKVIFNFSSYVHTDNDKSLLPKYLNFLLPNKKIELLRIPLSF